MKLIKNQILPTTCEFKDKDIELSFLAHSFSDFKKAIVPFFIAVMFIFVLFSIPDYLFLGDKSIFLWDFALRLSLIVIFVIIYFIFGRLRNFRSFLVTINAAELSFTIFYLIIISNYQNIDFLIKCMDIILIITFYFSFPNKWLSSVLQSLAIIASFAVFFILDTVKFEKSSINAAGAVYIGIAFILNCFNFYRINYYKRSQFYNTIMLKKLIYTDTLTGAFTRAKFNEDIKKQISIANKTGRPLAITIFDIDNFKLINDAYGHIEGDNVLAGIVDAVTKSKRPKDILTRWGGEEFVILFPATDLSTATKIANRFRLVIASTVFSIDERVTCSFGVTEYQQGDTPMTLLRRADKLMYDAKAGGKNCVTSDMQ